MYGYIDEINFIEEPAEKYWSFPKNYKGDKKEETKYMVKSGSYIGSLKQDGHYARFIKDEDGNMILQGRSKSVSGEYLNKIEWVPQCQSFFDSLPNGTCLLGELYFPNQKGSRKVTTILGCLKTKAIERQEKGEKLCYYVFDVWAYKGQSLLNIPFEKRINKYLNCELLKNFEKEKYIIKSQYYEGEELWQKIGEYLNNGEEGVVITKKDSFANPGKRVSRKTLKIKQEISETIDAFLTGKYTPATVEYKGKSPETWLYWLNDKTGEKVCENKFDEYTQGRPWIPISKGAYYGWGSSVEFAVFKDGVITPIGYISGIPDSLKQEIAEKTEDCVGRVAELSAMEVECIDGNYSLRHGKIITWRSDKRAEDCDFSQITDAT